MRNAHSSPLLTEALKQFQQKAEDFAQKYIAPLAQEIDKTNQFPRELWKKLGSAELLGITIDKQYGGTAQGYFAQALAVEAISRASGSIGLAYGAHANLCANHIFRFGTEQQKQRYLPKLNTGEWLGALAMSERNAGSDVLNMQLHAEEKKGHFILNGHKMWITNGTEADVIIVYAKTNSEAGPHGITAFVVEKTFSGFKPSSKLDKLGMRGCDTAELFFTNCPVPTENILGKINGGLAVLMGGLDVERAVLAAAPVGLMQACFDIMLPYVKIRKQFKKSLGDFQLIQEKIANTYAQLNAARNYAYATAALCDLNQISTEQAAAVYLFASECAVKIALDTIQCLGGIGYLNDSPAGRLLRDAKLYDIGAGTVEVRKIVVARELLK